MLTVKQAAELLGVRKARVFQLIKEGKLEAELKPANEGGSSYYLVTVESVIARKKKVGDRWEKRRHKDE